MLCIKIEKGLKREEAGYGPLNIKRKYRRGFFKFEGKIMNDNRN
jgi:hypothetical protein